MNQVYWTVPSDGWLTVDKAVYCCHQCVPQTHVPTEKHKKLKPKNAQADRWEQLKKTAWD